MLEALFKWFHLQKLEPGASGQTSVVSTERLHRGCVTLLARVPSATPPWPRLSGPWASGNVSLHPRARVSASEPGALEGAAPPPPPPHVTAGGRKWAAESTGDLSAQLETPACALHLRHRDKKNTSGAHTRTLQGEMCNNVLKCVCQIRQVHSGFETEEKATRPSFAFYNEEQRVTYAEYKPYM